jgi:uncharacterized protein with PIN domain
MQPDTVRVRIAESLRFLLPVRHRHGELVVPVAGLAGDRQRLTHFVESLGVPRTEIGEVVVAGDGAVEVRPVQRPQWIPEPRFLLDVHLGSLARRMRLLGIDTAYSNDADDGELVEQAIAERRVLLTQDRGLLRRRALPHGAYVHGDRADGQLADVLDRFAPPLAPWTRCPSCNGELRSVAKDEVEDLLEPGTRRSYTEFVRCTDCSRPYWHGAHAGRLDAIVRAAIHPEATAHKPSIQ